LRDAPLVVVEHLRCVATSGEDGEHLVDGRRGDVVEPGRVHGAPLSLVLPSVADDTCARNGWHARVASAARARLGGLDPDGPVTYVSSRTDQSKSVSGPVPTHS